MTPLQDTKVFEYIQYYLLSRNMIIIVLLSGKTVLYKTLYDDLHTYLAVRYVSRKNLDTHYSNNCVY